MHPAPAHDWRAAWLRGVCAGAAGATGAHALVATGPGQVLRVPLDEAERWAWQQRVGRCVWVDLAVTPYRLRAGDPEGRHA